ncbi:tryptophan 7-halogenase [Marinimicrobium sp. C6131]|uniref:tryptophan 7-halogenase n=1 Tax=Marinimicrobium sp. C6131 TaxID=3022676 RepID=UPI00223E2E5F|nr:tryptophan 7-halogenase [Marinimicrobium sp. C6131]UZJ44479.1 tryptophan 7-halogenase [Marinimicrobium sp. C6131]
MGKAPLQHLVVVGNGLVAAGTAVTLARFLSRYGTRITWVRAGPEDVSPVEVAQPPLLEWLAMVALPERDVMRRAQGLFSLGVMGQASAGGFFMPYGRHGIPAAPASFEHEFFHAYPRDEQPRFNEHFLATQAARRGRFDFPVNDPRSVKSTLRYGMTLDKPALCDLLADYADSLGVSCLRSGQLRVETDSARGIQSLCLDDERAVAGDFYLDATGDDALLIGRTLGVALEEASPLWSHQWIGRGEPSLGWMPYSTLTQEAWGWRRAADLQQSGIVEAWALPGEGTESDMAALHQSGTRWVDCPLVWGRRVAPWRDNCLALGRAAGQPGELLCSEWHRACQSLLLWLELLPDASGRPALRQEFNRRDLALFAGWRELHELLALGDHAGSDQATDTLRWRLQVFESFGRLWHREQEPLPDETRLALLIGLGWRANSADCLLAEAPPEALRRKHQRIYDTLVSAAERMPTLKQVIQHHCPAVV